MNSLISGIKYRAGGIGGAIKEGIGRILPEGVKKLIPGFADGVRNFGGGMAIVGERGPELVNLPKGSDVFSNEESRRMTSGGGGITIETMNIKSGVDWELGASYMAQKLRLS
jgi:phage-related protein